MSTKKLTINELMVLMKKVQQRANDFKSLRGQVATKESFYSGDNLIKQIEPQYDFKSLDRRTMELENFLFLADSKIKTANAVTYIDLEIDVDALLAPLD